MKPQPAHSFCKQGSLLWRHARQLGLLLFSANRTTQSYSLTIIYGLTQQSTPLLQLTEGVSRKQVRTFAYLQGQVHILWRFLLGFVILHYQHGTKVFVQGNGPFETGLGVIHVDINAGFGWAICAQYTPSPLSSTLQRKRNRNCYHGFLLQC